ncbi:MAG: glucosaminidase domain-containing protein [Xanthomonadales bacterium]|nr:glucosaminidase domain-containing protein [Xanthomonadales bacterium]
MHKTADELLSIAGQNTRNPAPSDPQARQGGSVGEFVSAYAPLAAKVGGEMGVDPSILLGQWGHETGWGKSVIPGTNNLGNIKDFSGRGVAATDNMTGSKDRYRAYGTPDDFGSDFLGLMSRKFQGAYGAGADPVKYAQALKDGGYAEDPNYVAGIQAATNKVRSIAGQLFPNQQKPFQRDRSDTPSFVLNLDAANAEIDRKANRGLMDAAADGLKRGFVQSQALTGGLAAFAGDAVGSGGLKQWGLDLYKRKMDESAKYSQNASFMDMWEGKRDTGTVPWAIDSLTYLGYQVFEGLVTGGVGALAGKAIGKAAIQSTLKGLVTSEVGNLSEKFLAEQVAKGLTKDAAQAAMTDTVKSQIGKQAAENAAGKMANAAQATAMFANNFRQEAGSIYGEAAEAGKTDNRLGEIFAWSIGAALADTGPEYLMQKQVLGGAGTKGFSGSYPARVAKAAALDSSMQGATEGVQTLMEQKGAGKEVGTPESWRDVIDSVAPAVLGGVAVAPAAGRHRSQPAAIDPAIQAAAAQPHSPLARAVVASQKATPPAQESAEQFRARSDVLPAGSFSQQNEFADLIQQEKADQAQRLAVQDTGPFANREPRQRAEQTPRGNFAQQSEFADLLNDEKADLQQRRDSLAQAQFAKAKLQFESYLESADARVAAGDMDRVQRDRLGILQGMLEDPQALTASPEFAVSAFMEQLTGRGVRNPSLTPEEQRIMGRFFDVRDAVDATDQTIPSAPNELDAANAGIREAAAPQVQQPAAGIRPGVMKAAQQSGNRIKGNQVLNRNGQRIARLNEAEQAAIAQSSRSPAENQPQVSPASEQVAADVSPIERISDASLNSEAQNVVSGDVPNSIQISETNEAPEQNSAEAVSPENNAQAVAPDVVQRLKDMARAWDFANRSSRNNEWQGGTAEASRSFNAIAEAGSRIPAHGMSKEATLSGGIDSLIRMLTGGIDPNRILFYDALSAPKGHSSGGATAGGVAYRDGPFIITLAEGLNGRQPTSDDILGVLVNPAHSEIVEPLQQMFPNLVIRDYFDVADVVAASRSVGASDNSAQDVNPPVVDSIPAGLDYADWRKAAGKPAAFLKAGSPEQQAERQEFLAYQRNTAIPDVRSDVDAAAHDAATSPLNDIPQPTEEQKEAGEYQKGRVEFTALKLTVDIENPAGSVREGVDSNGQRWTSTMRDHYGDLIGTKGADGDPLDVFIVPGLPSDWKGDIYVINQKNEDGSLDEHKAVIGAASEEEARAIYQRNYTPGWDGIMSVAQFKPGQFMLWSKRKDLKGTLAVTPGSRNVQQSNTRQVTEASSGKGSGEVVADAKAVDQEESRVILPGSELDQRAEAWDARVDAMTQDEARALYEAATGPAVASAAVG